MPDCRLTAQGFRLSSHMVFHKVQKNPFSQSAEEAK